MSDTVNLQLPELNEETGFFWTSGADGVLRIQRCGDCGHYQHPPLARCPRCASDAVAPAEVSGKGKVFSWTENCQQWLPDMQVPFYYAAVELAEQAGLLVHTRIDAPVGTVRTGQPVDVFFEQHEDIWLPLFRPAGRAA